MTSNNIIDRALPERSRLLFYFPNPSLGESNYTRIEIPFFENISVKESKKANYQKYSLISRSSNLYSYLGSDSRKLNLNFNISLPHILQEHPEVNLDKFVRTFDYDNPELEKNRFKQPNTNNTKLEAVSYNISNNYTRELATDSARQVLLNLESLGALKGLDKQILSSRYGLYGIFVQQELLNQATAAATSITPFGINPNTEQIISLANAGLEASEATSEQAKQQIEAYNSSQILKYKIIDLIIYWTNIIRASVTNNAKNPNFGPPVLRLRHGIMYQDIPCICTDYRIEYNESAGYDIDTLLPRQISISMTLEELRAGDFGEFNPKGNIIERDNLAGWESVVFGSTNSMDPGYEGII